MADQPDSPELHGWRRCNEEKPVPWQSVHVALADGTVRMGFWNGTAWVAGGAEVEPVYWQDAARR
jgi:hypothetical protein